MLTERPVGWGSWLVGSILEREGARMEASGQTGRLVISNGCSAHWQRLFRWSAALCGK